MKAVLALLAPALALQVMAPHQAEASNGLTIMRRDLCHSFKLDCRKQHSPAPAKRAAAKPKPRQPTPSAKPAPAVSTTPPKPQPRAATVVPAAPVPKEKPTEKPIAEAAPPPRAETAPAPPIPREKPAAEPAKHVADEAPAPASAAKEPPAPLPHERPSLLPSLPPVAPAITASPDKPDGGAAPDIQKPDAQVASIAPGAATAAGPSTCVQSLRAAKVQFDVVPASFGNAGCPVAEPVRLHSVETASGTVSFPEGPVFNCRFARQFAQWVSDTGSAVVLAQTSKRLEKLATGPGYDCRRRNGDSSAKMSEHAAGDAVDITSMTLDGGTTIRMADAINPAAPSFPVLRALRTTACGYFTTVLGPGANAAHKEHYHFDMGVHGKSANYRICE